MRMGCIKADRYRLKDNERDKSDQIKSNQIRSFEFFSGIPCRKKKARKSCCRNNNTSSRVLTAVGCWQPPGAGSPRVLAACTGAPRVLATPAFGDRVLAPARCSCWLAREMFRLLARPGDANRPSPRRAPSPAPSTWSDPDFGQHV